MRKGNKENLSLSVGETWLSNNLTVVCSLPQTASSCKLNSADLWGRETTQTPGWAIILLILTVAKEPQPESRVAMERRGEKVFMGHFICLTV